MTSEALYQVLLNNNSGEASAPVNPAPPSSGPPAGRFLRSHHKRTDTYASEASDLGSGAFQRFSTEPADSVAPCSTADSVCGPEPVEVAGASGHHARIVAKLVSKGMDMSDIADTLDIGVDEVNMLMGEMAVAGA
mmetsp:Transcript_94270/g.237709  ORF Transcript_94270/g.237709 Transcript_94270/m.237709 type:complete len:135 (+) Transcript_94270:3-407(+)